jgi:hypothetical protein
MDKLERFVKDRREEFDSELPAPDLWNKIEADLPARSRKLPALLWRAAAILLVFAAGWSIHALLNPQQKLSAEASNQDQISPMIMELAEAETYYTSMVETRRQEVESYLKDNPELLIELREEFHSLDSAYAQLKLDLSSNLAQEQIIEAMIQNHRIKVEILNELLQQLRTEKRRHESSEPL